MPIPETGVLPASREGGAVLDITTDRAGDGIVITVRGELDMQTVGRLRAALAQALADDGGAVVVDLSEVEFIDSTGLAALLNALRRLTRAGRRMALVPGDGPVRRILVLTRLDSTFALHGSPEEALAAS
jgi:anti-sigma B factor antagonist